MASTIVSRLRRDMELAAVLTLGGWGRFAPVEEGMVADALAIVSVLLSNAGFPVWVLVLEGAGEGGFGVGVVGVVGVAVAVAVVVVAAAGAAATAAEGDVEVGGAGLRWAA